CDVDRQYAAVDAVIPLHVREPESTAAGFAAYLYDRSRLHLPDEVGVEREVHRMLEAGHVAIGVCDCAFLDRVVQVERDVAAPPPTAGKRQPGFIPAPAPQAQ